MIGIKRSVPETALDVVEANVGRAHCTTRIWDIAPAEKVTVKVSLTPAAAVAEYKLDK